MPVRLFSWAFEVGASGNTIQEIASIRGPLQIQDFYVTRGPYPSPDGSDHAFGVYFLPAPDPLTPRPDQGKVFWGLQAGGPGTGSPDLTRPPFRYPVCRSSPFDPTVLHMVHEAVLVAALHAFNYLLVGWSRGQ